MPGVGKRAGKLGCSATFPSHTHTHTHTHTQAHTHNHPPMLNTGSAWGEKESVTACVQAASKAGKPLVLLHLTESCPAPSAADFSYCPDLQQLVSAGAVPVLTYVSAYSAQGVERLRATLQQLQQQQAKSKERGSQPGSSMSTAPGSQALIAAVNQSQSQPGSGGGVASGLEPAAVAGTSPANAATASAITAASTITTAAPSRSSSNACARCHVGAMDTPTKNSPSPPLSSSSAPRSATSPLPNIEILNRFSTASNMNGASGVPAFSAISTYTGDCVSNVSCAGGGGGPVSSSLSYSNSQEAQCEGQCAACNPFNTQSQRSFEGRGGSGCYTQFSALSKGSCGCSSLQAVTATPSAPPETHALLVGVVGMCACVCVCVCVCGRGDVTEVVGVLGMRVEKGVRSVPEAQPARWTKHKGVHYCPPLPTCRAF